MKSFFNVDIAGHIKADYVDTGEVVLDVHNAVHPRNMARILARGLANEPNSSIYRLAVGNGGSFTDVAGNIVLNPPNTGSDTGWEDRLYNEVYSEVVDETSALLGTDIGSADGSGTRIGGGSSELDDPAGTGVVSNEVGRRSTVVITAYINQNEPFGQLSSQSDGPFDENKRIFEFDEIGLYSSGKAAAASSGFTSIDVGNRNSSNFTPLLPETEYFLSVVIDANLNGNGGQVLSTSITTPSSGSGPLGQITYGDLCEALNTNSWNSGGNNLGSVLYFYITDLSPSIGDISLSPYPSIYGANSFGYFVAQRRGTGSTGPTSAVSFNCSAGSAFDVVNVLSGGECVDRVNVNSGRGTTAGLSNDPVQPLNERERLLTHATFAPVLKTSDRALRIVYTLTIAVDCNEETSSTLDTAL